jgi:hypothetical protein
MLSCGGGFAHPGLENELEGNDYEIIEFSGTKKKNTYGWSMGALILLRYLESTDFQENMSTEVVVVHRGSSSITTRMIPSSKSTRLSTL